MIIFRSASIQSTTDESVAISIVVSIVDLKEKTDYNRRLFTLITATAPLVATLRTLHALSVTYCVINYGLTYFRTRC